MSLRLAILLTLTSGIFGCADDVSITLVKRAEQASDKVAAVAPKVKENDIDQQSNSKYPLITVDPALICNDISFINSDGDLKQGTKECSEAVFCTSDGQANCLANSSFPAAAAQNLADKVISGQTVAGISGSATLPPSCSSDGQTACLVIGPTFASGAVTGAGDKIISGQSLGGVTGNVVIPAATKVLAGTAFGVNGTSMTGTLTLPLAANVLAASSSYGEAGAQLVPSYTPDFPDLANVRSIDSVGGVAGTLTNCSTGNQTGCVTTATVKSMDVSAASAMTDLTLLNFNATAATAASFEFWDSTGTRHQVAGDADLSAANILSGVTIFGAAGSLTALPANCSSSGSQACVATGSYYAAAACTADSSNCFVPSYVATTQPLKAISYDAIDAGKAAIQSTLTLSGIAGTLATCSAANQDSCVATSTYKTMNLSAIGTDTGLTASNFNATIKAGANFEFWDAAGARHSVAGDADLAVGNFANAINIFGTIGTATLESHSPCSASNQTGCIATSTYKTMDVSSATGGMTDLTSGNFNTTVATAANFEFWDSTGVRHQVAGDSAVAGAKFLSSVTIFGVAGTVTAAPANCSSNGSQACVATGSYYAAAACAADSSNCFVPSYVATTQPLKAISYDAIDAGKAAIRTTLTLSGIAGTLATCSAANQDSCVATSTYKTMDLTNATGGMTDLTTAGFNTAIATAANFEFWDSAGARYQGTGDSDLIAANIANGIVIHGVTGSVAAESHSNCASNGAQSCVAAGSYYAATACASNGADTCYVNPAGSYDAADLSNLTAANIKRGVSIAGTTGDFPSATSALPRYSDSGATTGTAGSDETDLTSFITQLTSAGTFEYWDSSGIRRTGSGDGDLVNANIKNTVAIESLSLTGNYVATFSCPTGWIMVPGDSAYGTGDFCVMKYEAKDVSTVATSQTALTPWGSITQTAAITACRALGTGYDMISNPQWMTIGSNVAALTANWTSGTVGTGYLFSGHNDLDPNSACAASSNDTLFYVETTCTAVSTGDATEQRRTLTLSNSNVIWDLSGNIWEWVNYINVGDKPGATNAYYEYTAVTGTTTTALKDLVPTNAVKAYWSNAWNSTKWIGTYYPGTNGSGGALIRGGVWGYDSYAGVFTAYLNYAPSLSNNSIGFRCTSSPQ